LFPDLRYGAELYKSLPRLAAGFRTLKYSTTTTIYTGALVGTPAIVIGHCVLILLREMEEQAHQQPSIIVNIGEQIL
jgi:hypothetical protein